MGSDSQFFILAVIMIAGLWWVNDSLSKAISDMKSKHDEQLNKLKDGIEGLGKDLDALVGRKR